MKRLDLEAVTEATPPAHSLMSWLAREDAALDPLVAETDQRERTKADLIAAGATRQQVEAVDIDREAFRRVEASGARLDGWLREAIVAPLATFASKPRRAHVARDTSARWQTPTEALRALYGAAVGWRQRPERNGPPPPANGRSIASDPHMERGRALLAELAGTHGVDAVRWLMFADVELWPTVQETREHGGAVDAVVDANGHPQMVLARSGRCWALQRAVPPQSQLEPGAAWWELVAEREIMERPHTLVVAMACSGAADGASIHDAAIARVRARVRESVTKLRSAWTKASKAAEVDARPRWLVAGGT